MAGQERISNPGGRPDDDAAEVAAPVVRKDDAEVDSLLDDIDAVLESNAESFVRGFVQKGGQ
ncbi:ubiquitin-like protein Pup [Paraoerskovia marina]|uniref:Prokaryotic ubiquitin-like protein Pup n=1 Tax=Paraoerskovia marina TaxID=545619 RepID=A0A1H1T9G0_9CELL|nr:ubiquitin-like protein Pup [Paraoerskovia marina]SDS56857.1 prokaryotic ubiquitin-like protein Pup [Paraoerskovia marina]